MPIRARVPINTVAEGANADIAEPTPKMTRPMVSARVATEAVAEAA